MPAVSAPYGLRPVQRLGSDTFNGGGIRQYPLATNVATAYYFGDLVQVKSGVPTVCTTTPTSNSFTTNATPHGVFFGVSYTSNNIEYFDQYLPANAITNGASNVIISLMEDPFCVFQCQASGSVATTNIGKNIALKNFGSPNTTQKISGIQLDTSAVGTTTTYAMRIVDIPTTPTGSPGDAYTDCLVVFNAQVHAYLQNNVG